MEYFDQANPENQEIVRLYNEKVSPKSISLRLGIPYKAVRNRIYRARLAGLLGTYIKQPQKARKFSKLDSPLSPLPTKLDVRDYLSSGNSSLGW